MSHPIFVVTISSDYLKDERVKKIEYYAVALSPKDTVMARAGTLQELFSVTIDRPVPIYKKGWFWGVVAGSAVLVAGATTAAVLLTRPSGYGSVGVHLAGP